MGNEHELVEDVDAQTLIIKLVKFLKRGKAPGPDTIHNDVLRLGTTTSLFHHLTRLFTSSIQLGYIPTPWKIATLRMLLKPDKLTLYNVCAVPWGGRSVPWGVFSTVGDILSTVGAVQYHGGIS